MNRAPVHIFQPSPTGASSGLPRFSTAMPRASPWVGFSAIAIQRALTKIVYIVNQRLADTGHLAPADRIVEAHGLDELIPGGVVWVSAQRTGSGVACSVTDNGVGIEAERLSKIFASGESDSPAGFGLGLSIVQRLVEAHGGSLSVESEPGQGASFRFDLPDWSPG